MSVLHVHCLAINLCGMLEGSRRARNAVRHHVVLTFCEMGSYREISLPFTMDFVLITLIPLRNCERHVISVEDGSCLVDN